MRTMTSGPNTSKAATLHAQLCAGIEPNTVIPGMDLPSGEVAHTWCTGLTYSRFVVPEPVAYHRPPQWAVGSTQFVTGFVLSSVVSDVAGRRRARRMSQPRWTPPTLGHAALTNRRLICFVDGHVMDFDYTAMISVTLRDRTVTFTFSTNPAPLVLAGPHAAIIAVYAAHRVYGSAQAARMPALASLC